ncbi:MAG TPA: OmpA family protein [Chthoniobacterales bacterium]
MAGRVGKCTNYSGCKLAYRNEKITVVTKDFRCPECGSPLEPFGSKKAAPYTLFALLGVGAVLLLAVGAILWTVLSPSDRRVVIVDAGPSASPTLLTPPPSATPAGTSTPTPVPSAAPEPTPAAVVSPSASATGALNFDTSNPEIATVRREILRRIERSPYPQAQKDRAYELVDRAHGMGRLFTVAFETSNVKLSPEDATQAQNQVTQPQIKKLLEDPAVVLVVLGYADRQGVDVRNQQLSQERAQAVLEFLRDKCSVLNVMYPFAMGGTDLFDQREFAKNRIVEVWAVLP